MVNRIYRHSPIISKCFIWNSRILIPLMCKLYHQKVVSTMKTACIYNCFQSEYIKNYWISNSFGQFLDSQKVLINNNNAALFRESYTMFGIVVTTFITIWPFLIILVTIWLLMYSTLFRAIKMLKIANCFVLFYIVQLTLSNVLLIMNTVLYMVDTVQCV